MESEPVDTLSVDTDAGALRERVTRPKLPSSALTMIVEDAEDAGHTEVGSGSTGWAVETQRPTTGACADDPDLQSQGHPAETRPMPMDSLPPRQLANLAYNSNRRQSYTIATQTHLPHTKADTRVADVDRTGVLEEGKEDKRSTPAVEGKARTWPNDPQDPVCPQTWETFLPELEQNNNPEHVKSSLEVPMSTLPMDADKQALDGSDSWPLPPPEVMSVQTHDHLLQSEAWRARHSARDDPQRVELQLQGPQQPPAPTPAPTVAHASCTCPCCPNVYCCYVVGLVIIVVLTAVLIFCLVQVLIDLHVI